MEYFELFDENDKGILIPDGNRTSDTRFPEKSKTKTAASVNIIVRQTATEYSRSKTNAIWKTASFNFSLMNLILMPKRAGQSVRRIGLS